MANKIISIRNWGIAKHNLEQFTRWQLEQMARNKNLIVSSFYMQRQSDGFLFSLQIVRPLSACPQAYSKHFIPNEFLYSVNDLSIQFLNVTKQIIIRYQHPQATFGNKCQNFSMCFKTYLKIVMSILKKIIIFIVRTAVK